MAKKPRRKSSKKTYPKEVLLRAAGVAAGLEASFTSPPPPGAMAPAPLLDEIREMGEAGAAGVLSHLSSTAPEGRVPTLLALRELGDSSVVPRLVSLIRAMRWSISGLAALAETIRSLDAKAELPAGLDAENLERAREAAARLRKEDLSADSAKPLAASLKSLPPLLAEAALRDGLEDADGVLEKRALALAEAMAAEGASPPAHLIRILARLGTRDAALALRSLSKLVGDKDALSLIRKAAFRLKSGGVEIEEPPGADARGAPRTGRPDYARAAASAVDGRGQMLLWLARSRIPRGRYLAQARLRRGRGIVEFTDAEMSARELRDVFRRVSEIPALATSEVPAGYAVWLLERARRENEAGETPLPPGFTRAKLMLDPLAEPDAFPPEGPHPLRGAVGVLEEGGERVETRALFAHRPFWGWAMDEERAAPYFREFLQSMESRVAMDERQRRERLRQIVENGAKELFRDRALRERIAGQLEDNGYLFHRAGDEGMARECLTLADEALEDADEPPALLIEMVQHSISAMLERIIRQARESRGEEGEAPEEAGAGGAPESADAEDSPVIIAP